MSSCRSVQPGCVSASIWEAPRRSSRVADSAPPARRRHHHAPSDRASREEPRYDMHGRRLILIVSLLVATSAGADVAPVGGEFQVNTFTPGYQMSPRVCADDGGRFTVVWESGQDFFPPGPDGSRSAIAARRYDATGIALGDEFVVNSYAEGPQRDPAIASTPNGDFVVAWQGGTYNYPQDGSESGAFVRQFSNAGVPRGAEFRANTMTAGAQLSPAVAADATGRFVVVWTSYPAYYGTRGGDGNGAGVFGQRFDAAGMPLGAEFQVNTYTTGFQSRPRVAADPTGSFVVVWESLGGSGAQDGQSTGVFGQRFDSRGVPLGDEFQVNSYTTGPQFSPEVSMDATGSFVVVWESSTYPVGQDGDESGVFGQRFDVTGARVGDEFQVNTYTTGSQQYPAIAIDGGGSFTVVWESFGYPVGPDGDRSGVFGQHFASTGDPIGEEFQVNTYINGAQGNPHVASDHHGHFRAVWTAGGFRGGQDGDRAGIFAQRLHATRTTPPPRLHGERLVLRDAPGDARKRRLALRSRDAAVLAGAADGNPSVSGGTLRVWSASFDHTYQLPAANWRRRGLAWESRDRALLAGPISQVVVRSGKLRISGQGAQLEHALGTNPDPVSVLLRLGADGVRQCLSFGGAAEYVPGKIFRARNAPPPATCR